QVAPIAASLAETLLKRSQEIIGVLVRDCGATFKPKPKIAKVARNIDGNILMEFTAEPGLIHIVEASTNLVDWDKIGVAVSSDTGGFEFEDLQAPRFTSRYYRI